jgi:putative oxidoreductase
MDTSRAALAILLIRIAAGGNLLIHGLTRVGNGTVPDFDVYLSTIGFPPFTAWIITIFEIAAAVLFIAGKWITPIAILFSLELCVGIILIHFSEGWFVVGAGRNGMEYSVLLIICFSSVAIFHRRK